MTTRIRWQRILFGILQDYLHVQFEVITCEEDVRLWQLRLRENLQKGRDTADLRTHADFKLAGFQQPLFFRGEV